MKDIVLAFTESPAALTESLFLTNEFEAALLREGAGGESSRSQEIAEGHLVGILNYFEYFVDTD